jgi:uncharacterized membrane protein YhiD involved in acid resistance
MPEWLSDSFRDVEVPLGRLAIRLAVGFVLGCVVAAIYRLTQRGPRSQAPGLTPTLVLLTVVIGMVTLVIGNNVARAFSLVGALAIVRFRTVVEDTRDTAFVIFAVAVGMAVGAGFVEVPLVGIPFVAVAAFLFRGGEAIPAEHALDYLLTVRIGAGHDPEQLLREPFGKHLEWARLLATATSRQGAALDLSYSVRLVREEAAVLLTTDLNGREGVQSVELRRK